MKRRIELTRDDNGEVFMASDTVYGEVWYPEKDEPEGTERTWDGFLQTLFQF